jgi:hypothetical protein
MTQPIDPELRNAVLNIVAILTGLELGEDEAVTAILEQPLPVEQARAYIRALLVLSQHLVQEVAAATDVETVEVLRQIAEAIGQ